MITWIEGDLFSCGIPVLAHGVNCRGIMGAGIAAQFRQRYPQMAESYRKRCAKGELIPGDVMTWQHPGGVIFNLATQPEPGPAARPWMIAAAVGSMIAEAHHYRGITQVAMPLIGCGLGGLDPSQLRVALTPYQDAPVDLVVITWKAPS